MSVRATSAAGSGPALPGRRPSPARRIVLGALGVAVSAVALWLCLRAIDLAEVGRLLARAGLVPIGLLLLVLATQTTLRAARWTYLLPQREGRRIATRRALPPLLVGYLGNAVLPARLGEPARALALARRERFPAAAVFGSVVLERIVDTATLALVVLPAAWLVGAPVWIVSGAAIAAAGSAAVLAILGFAGLDPLVRLAGRVPTLLGRGAANALGAAAVERFAEFADGVGTAGRRPAVLAATIASTVAWVLDATLMWLAATALGVTLDPAEAVLIAGVTVLVTVIPAGPGFVGTYELAATTTALALGIDGEVALAFAILAHAVTLAALALAGAAVLAVAPRGLAAVGGEASPEGSVGVRGMADRAITAGEGVVSREVQT